MDRLSQAPDRLLTKFKTTLSNVGFNPHDLEGICEYPEVARAMHEAVKRHPRFNLVHFVYNHPRVIYEQVVQRCKMLDINFSRFSFVGSPQTPTFTDDREYALVLVVRTDSFPNSVQFANGWMSEGRTFLQNKLDLTSRDRLVPLERFQPWTIEWCRIKLDAHVGKTPAEVRSPRQSPGLAMLYLAAQHPERIKEIMEHRRSGFWVPGLKYTNPESKAPLGDVPRFTFDESSRRAVLEAAPQDETRTTCSVPVILPPEARQAAKTP